METVTAILAEMLTLYLEAAPWLIAGIAAAGLVHAYMPDGLMGRWLGGRGVWPVVKAAVLGAPLPLCSCGVLPAAVGLRREGASKGATVSFLIATPETGPDSVAVSYALLGPVMAVVRPVAAVLSAVIAGLMTLAATRGEADAPASAEAKEGASCGSGTCCAPGCSASNPLPQGPRARAWAGLRYALTDIMDDITLWLIIGLVVAGVLAGVVPPQGLADYGSGLPAMLVMLAVGVPLYVCATASTPIAAGLMAAGVSPGAALVFLLAGPATNIATLGVVGKDLGMRALTAYLGGIALSSLALGWALDFGLAAAGVDIQLQMGQAGEVIPEPVKWLSALALAPFFARSLFHEAKKRFA